MPASRAISTERLTPQGAAVSFNPPPAARISKSLAPMYLFLGEQGQVQATQKGGQEIEWDIP